METIKRKSSLIIGVDVDGVLRDFTGGLNNSFRIHFPKYAHTVKDEVTHWDWFFDYPWDKIIEELNISAMSPREYAIQWALNSPATEEILEFANAYDDIHKGLKLLKDNFETIRIITHQRNWIQKKATIKWLAHNDIDLNQIIMVDNSPEKWQYCDIMIDDSPEVLAHKQFHPMKKSIKINWAYNKDSEADYNADTFYDAAKLLTKLTK